MTTVRKQQSVGSLAALTGAAVALLITAVPATAWPSFPFPPVVVAEGIAAAIPGRIAAFFIDALQHTALPLTVVGTGLALALVAWELGRAIPWLDRRLPGGPVVAAGAAALPLYVVSVSAFHANTTTVLRAVFAVVLAVAFAVGAWVAGRTYARLLAVEGDQKAADDLARRSFLRAAALGTGAMVLGVARLGRLVSPAPDPGAQALHLRDVSPAAPGASSGEAAFGSIPGLTPRVTSNADHYVVDEELFDPVVDAKTWKLSVSGLVDRPISIGYQELLAMPAIEQYVTLECISNEVGGDLMSTAKWTGVPLRQLLERAGVKPGAVEVVSRAIGGYSDSLPLSEALRPGVIVAVGMNGQVLPRAHGFPARLIAPGHYGMKQPKWLQSLEVVDTPYQGYWEHRGWSKTAVVKTTARTDTTGASAAPYELAGIAFAGDRGVEKVEVSLDGGTTWTEAVMESALSKITWRRWRLPLPAATGGTVAAWVRATDGDGVVQTRTVAGTYPSGASGWQESSFSV